MIANVSPLSSDYEPTKGTLDYAKIANDIKTKAAINKEQSAEGLNEECKKQIEEL